MTKIVLYIDRNAAELLTYKLIDWWFSEQEAPCEFEVLKQGDDKICLQITDTVEIGLNIE